MKIYLVTAGNYSDYRMIGAFSTLEKAQEFVTHMSKDAVRWPRLNDFIEEYEVDDFREQLAGNLFSWRVAMDAQGNCPPNFGDMVTQQDVPPSPEEAAMSTFYGGKPFRWFMWEGWARDREHALKCANEHRLKLLANTPA